ncbi:uncharacterized protein LOC141760704 [Sebastes fasciatus]|uniref:uncharacterized protein LOC141760704 n=1 Tax=Sebastes fasciatus TaxID=394691 RepID=UPI003D9F0719
MIGNPVLYSRLLFVFVPVCAAVMSFIMCSDAARASPITTQVDYGVRHNVLRRLYPPHSQHRPLFTGLPSTETGLQTGTNGEIETSGNYRGASSIIDRRSNPVWFTEGSYSYNQNSPDNRQYRAGVRPAGSSSSYRPLSYNSVIIRKSSLNKAAGLSHQSSEDAQKSYMNEKVPSLFSSQTDRYWSTPLPTSRGLYRSYKDTNELAAAGARSTSSGIQSNKYFGFASQTAPHAPSIRNGLDASVIKSIPSPEKLTDFSQGWHSVSSGDTPRHKKVQSYLFKDPQTSLGGHETVHGSGPTTAHKQRASDSGHYSRFSSNVKQLQRKDPIEAVQHLSDNANPLYHNANVAQYGAQTGVNTKHTTQISVYPALGKDATMGSFVPTPHADFRATGSSKSVVSGSVNTNTRGSMHAHTPGRDVKSIYGFRGFENPTRTPILSSNERTNARGYSFDKGKGYKITNMYPSLSPKYSFGQRGAKPERTPTPSPGTHQDFTSGFASDASVVDRSPDLRQLRIHRRIYGLKGFSTRPLEGAKTLASEPDKSATVKQGFEGFKVRSSQTWQPRSSQNEQSSEDLKPLLQTESVTSFTPDEYQKRRKIYSFPGFLPIQTGIVNAHNDNKTHKQNTSYVRSAEKLESRPKSEPRTPKETKPVERKASLFNRSTSSTVRGKRVRGNGEKLNASTPTYVNAPIVRLSKRPARVITVTYADILGSASFSGVTATTQTSITPTDNTAATTELKEEAGHWTIKDAVLSRDNTSRGPDEAEDVEESKFSVRSEDSGMKTSDLFLDNEGSGSGAFNMFDVLSTDTTESLSEDSSELEYLRISTSPSSQ